MTWDVIFQRAKDFVLIEIEHLEALSSKKAEDKVTESTKTMRMNKITVSFE